MFSNIINFKFNIFKSKFHFFFISIHVVLSFISSFFFFKPIFDDTGFETIAYNGSDIIPTLQYDSFIKSVCMIYSYFFAIILIIFFWTIIFKAKDLYGKYFKLYLILLIFGLLILLLIYPYFLTSDSTCDFTYNYVYAKEFMPMHWHGFFTNVFLCACMIFYPHPACLSCIPFFMLFSLIFFFILDFTKDIKKIPFVILFILFLPEIIPSMSTPGRNSSYAIVSALYFFILLYDFNNNNNKLTSFKFLILTVLICILSTWRTEGIIFIFFTPFLLSFVYNRNKHFAFKKCILIRATIFIIILLILKLPHEYGIKKYYEKDYFIINTPMPLSAVFLSDSKNFLYSGFDNDLKNINSAYPTEYLTEYGGNASIRNNIENKRISRQCGIGFNSNKYIFSAYNILLHNPIIFFKKQLNNYLISNGFYQKFYFKSPKFTSITDGISEDALEFYNKVNEYYYIGKNDININYPLFTKYTIGKKINHFLTFIYKIWHYLGKHFMKYNKVLVTISMVLCVLICLLKKEFVLFFIGSNILAIFLAVFLFAPDPHYEYYYSTYICQYLFLSYFIKTILKKGMKTI